MNINAAHDAFFDLMDDATADASVAYDDGDMVAVSAFLADATETQRRHFTEEVAITNAKRARAAAYDVPAPRSTTAARGASTFLKTASGDYEDAILRSQERYCEY